MVELEGLFGLLPGYRVSNVSKLQCPRLPILQYGLSLPAMLMFYVVIMPCGVFEEEL
jgi:hypothetical protein